MDSKVEPTLLIIAVLYCVKFSKKVDNGIHSLFSVQYLEPHRNLNGIESELDDPSFPIPKVVMNKLSGWYSQARF